jgi:hypothetical protein
MNEAVDTDRRTWNEAIKLAVIISIVAGLVAVVASTAGNIPQAAIVLPVIVVAFAASWIQTGRVRGASATAKVVAPSNATVRSGSLHHS